MYSSAAAARMEVGSPLRAAGPAFHSVSPALLSLTRIVSLPSESEIWCEGWSGGAMKMSFIFASPAPGISRRHRKWLVKG